AFDKAFTNLIISTINVFLFCLTHSFVSLRLVHSLLALAVSSLTISVVFAVIPLCHKLLLLAFALAVSGLAMGIIDTISNLQLVKIYQKDSTVFLQALHFFVGLGALVSPLIADPFLSETSCVIGNSSTNATSLRHLRNKLAGRHVHNVSSVHLHTDGEVVTNVSYAFWIMAIINLPVPIAILILMYRERLFTCGSDPSQRLLDGDVVLGFSMRFVYTFCAYIVYIFFLVYIKWVGVIVTLLLLLIFSNSSVFLFIGTCCLGLFISSIFPCTLAFTEDVLEYKGIATDGPVKHGTVICKMQRSLYNTFFHTAFPSNSPTERLEENGIKTCSAAVLNSWDTSEQKASIDP
uniref:Major facilitator superfamily domain containing 4Aa n=1 Tax=Sinocyclocheilus grahami TaxID=75366 RepID=A0A672R5L5_SINGR